jgi:GNAT superfamily N-acetyltransferase
MKHHEKIKPTPWDSIVFGMPTWELLEYSEASLILATNTSGHHTIKVNPLINKKLLHDYGFYYCDTLIEPYCNKYLLKIAKHPNSSISREFDKQQLLKICHGAFKHGRFHRDFNLPLTASDQRYNNWLEQLIESNQVYALFWQDRLAGFIGYSENNLVLHAVSETYRGQGLAKFWWSSACAEILNNGHQSVKSSISTTNIPVLRLYASLGFSFCNPQDVYHLLVP